MVIGLRLEQECQHCGYEYNVMFRKRVPDGQLEAMVTHGFIQGPWQPVYGFEEMDKITAARGKYEQDGT